MSIFEASEGNEERAATRSRRRRRNIDMVKDSSWLDWYDHNPDPKVVSQASLKKDAKALVNKEVLDKVSVAHVEDVWDRFLYCYFLYRRNCLMPVNDLRSAIDAKRWELSGLESTPIPGHENNTLFLSAVAINSLHESITSGRIQAIVGRADTHIDTLSQILEHRHNMPVTHSDSANYDPSELTKYEEQLRHHHNVMKRIIREAKDSDVKIKHYGGPYKNLYGEIVNQARAALAEIDPLLDMDALHAKDYQSRETRRRIFYMDDSRQRAVADLALWRLSAFRSVAEYTWRYGSGHVNKDGSYPRPFKDQTITRGLMDIPGYTQQHHPMGCATATFRMVYQGVTGQFVSEQDIRDYIEKQHGSSFVVDDEYLKFFETQTFHEEYGKKVQSLCFMGMDLDAIEATVRKLKAKHTGAEVYVVAALRTKALMTTSLAQHRVVLCSADQDNVHVLDPRADCIDQFGETAINKWEFCDRWAGTHNSGYLVIAKPQI